MKIAICSPLSNIQEGFKKSLDDLVKFHDPQHEVELFHTYGMSGIAKVRNRITEMALAWEPDYLLWLDDDMFFNSDLMDRLVATKKEFVCAEMFSKTFPIMPTMKKVNGLGIFDYCSFKDYPMDSLFEIAACGFAATLVHRRVFESVAKKTEVGTVWFEENSYGLGESEDYNFCFKAREQGYKIWCDSSVTTRHIGGVGVGRENYLYWKDKTNAKVF